MLRTSLQPIFSLRKLKEGQRPKASSYDKFMDIELSSPLGRFGKIMCNCVMVLLQLLSFDQISFSVAISDTLCPLLSWDWTFKTQPAGDSNLLRNMSGRYFICFGGSQDLL